MWRAIGTSEEDLHLYCETCVKASQKRKMRQEHTALLRKELERVMEKEQVNLRDTLSVLHFSQKRVF